MNFPVGKKRFHVLFGRMLNNIMLKKYRLTLMVWSSLKCNAAEVLLFSSSLQDGYKWKHDSRTSWKGFRTVRYRDCNGGYTYPNISCSYFIEFDKNNTKLF